MTQSEWNLFLLIELFPRLGLRATYFEYLKSNRFEQIVVDHRYGNRRYGDQKLNYTVIKVMSRNHVFVVPQRNDSYAR